MVKQWPLWPVFIGRRTAVESKSGQELLQLARKTKSLSFDPAGVSFVLVSYVSLSRVAAVVRSVCPFSLSL